MNEPFTIEEVKSVPLEILLAQVFPENKVMLRDSGLWMIYEGDEDTDDVEYEQSANESFRDFITRSIHDMICKDQPDENGDMGIGLDFITATVLESENKEFRCGQGENRCNCSRPRDCAYIEFNKKIAEHFSVA